MKILLTGATGLIGTELSAELIKQGHELFLITRDAKRAKQSHPIACEWVEGDLGAEPIRDRRLGPIEAVVNMLGETVAQSRWNETIKNKIYNSRVLGTKNLLTSLKDSPLKVFVSTSAAGFYGDRHDEVLTENSKPGSGFLSEVCQDWERAVQQAEQQSLWPNCRFVIFRMPMVLSRKGGGLAQMLPFFKLGLGGPIGDGKNWMPWVHIDDVVEKYSKALVENDFQGVYNLCSAEPVRNLHFSQSLAAALGKKLFLPIPSMALKIRYGEMAHVLLSSQKMVPERLILQKMPMRYDTIESAMKDVVGRV